MPGYHTVPLTAPVALAASGAEAARIGLEKHDAAAARQGLDVLNGALAEMDAAGRQLTAAWACAPALIEGRLWHARADALSARLARLTGGAEADRLDSDADREFRATLVLSLYSRGGNEDFRNARDAYLVFMREAVREYLTREEARQSLRPCNCAMRSSAVADPQRADDSEWASALDASLARGWTSQARHQAYARSAP